MIDHPNISVVESSRHLGCRELLESQKIVDLHIMPLLQSWSQSSVNERCSTSQHTTYAEGDAAEDKNWDDHNTADLIKVFSWIYELCDLSPPPYEGQKVQSIKAVHSMVSRPSSSYCLPIGSPFDIVKEVGEKFSILQLGKKYQEPF